MSRDVMVLFVFEAPKDTKRVALHRKLFGYKATYRVNLEEGYKESRVPGILDKDCRIDQSTLLVPKEKEETVEKILQMYAKSYKKFYVVEAK